MHRIVMLLGVPGLHCTYPILRGVPWWIVQHQSRRTRRAGETMASFIQRLCVRRQKPKPTEPKNEVCPMPESEDPSPLPHPTPITTHLHAVHAGLTAKAYREHFSSRSTLTRCQRIPVVSTWSATLFPGVSRQWRGDGGLKWNPTTGFHNPHEKVNHVSSSSHTHRTESTWIHKTNFCLISVGKFRPDYE